MKITDLYVEDRRPMGQHVEPVLVLAVDEPVNEVGTPIKYGPKFRKIGCGPFVAIETWDQKGSHERDGMWVSADRAEISTFNVNGYHHEQLAPLVVVSDGEPREWLTMGVQRLRRLMRKYKQDQYELLVDELSALNGRLNWRVELKTPVCFTTGCHLTPTKCVWYGGAHINFCEGHLAQHDRIRTSTR